MSNLLKHDFEMAGSNNTLAIEDILSRKAELSSDFSLLEHSNAAQSAAQAAGELGNEWDRVEQSIENAISVMEKAFPYMQLGTRNEVWHSLHRCYQRAKSIRKLRGVESIDDHRDDAIFLDNRCMLGVLI